MLHPQQQVTQMGLLEGPFSCVLDMPTGSGKTWLAEQAIRQTVANGARAIYLTPLRALAAEVAGRWKVSLPNVAVGVFTGEFGRNASPYPVSFEDARVLVMTPERLDACTRAWRSHWGWIPEVDLVVVDEIHLLGEASRGPRLEGAISRLRRLNPFIRLVGLSATIGNAPEIADWLEGVSYQSRWRPIPLEWRTVHYRKASDKPGLLKREVECNVQGGGKSLVFVQSRRRAEELSRYLGTEGSRARHHHAGLRHDERRQTEDAFRAGQIDVLVATGTLEMGLNLPVRQVVLYDLQNFDGRDFVPLSTNSVWQRVGRAGRPGLDEHGEAVLLAPVWDSHANHYQRGLFEPIRSQMNHSAAFAEQVVAEVASGASTTRPQLQRAFRQSLAARQGVLTNCDAVVNEMCEAGLLREWTNPDRPRAGLVLKATKAGRIAVRHMLMPETILGLQRAIRAFPDLTYLDLLIVLALAGDCEPVLAVDFEELDSLAATLSQEPSYLLRQSPMTISEMLSVSPRRLLCAFKMACVTRTWTRCGDAVKAAEEADCYPFEVTRLHESMARLLQALGELLAVAKSEQAPSAIDDEVPILERVQALQRMVTFGLDEDVATLCFVHGIGGTFARRLAARGIGDIEELANADAEDLASVKGVSTKRMVQWIEEAARLIKTRHGLSLRDLGPKTAAKPSNWPHDIDPYRLRRSLDLTVQQIGPTEYRVAGGLEPHQVTAGGTMVCDCMDRQRGHVCKHILAVRGYCRETIVVHLVRILEKDSNADGLDLLQLWLTRDRLHRTAESA